MKVDIWMPLYINDYLGDTMHLNAEENGVYLLLMMHYWKKGYLQNNISGLAIVTRSSEDITLCILNEFFSLNKGKWTHSRIDKELQNASSRRDSARINGLKGGRPKNPQETHGLREGKPTENPKGNPQKTSSPSPSPLSSEEEKINKKEKIPPPPPKGAKRSTLHFNFIEDPEWKRVYKEWAQNKKSPYRKQLGLEKGFTHLKNISSNDIETARKIIDNSLANNWAGLFVPEDVQDEAEAKRLKEFLDDI